MSKSKRKFSPEEKLSILQECEQEGFVETCRKYNLSQSTVSYWKRKYLAKGREGLEPGYARVDPEKRKLEEENARLKRIVAKQALEIEFKDELIKKSRAHRKKGNGS